MKDVEFRLVFLISNYFESEYHS